jgi:flagella basal body P-ring formation protein FlgA
MKTLLLLSVVATLAHAGCVAVSTDHITAGELASVVPAFQTLDAATSIGFSPLPGTQRILSARELVLFAQRNGLSAEGIAASVCVERLAHPIDAVELKKALFEALNIGEAELDLVDFYNLPVPPGHFEFKRSGLIAPNPPDAPAMWRGKLLYDGSRSVPVWAKVKVTVKSHQFVAASAISAGTIITAEQVQEVEASQFPFADPAPATLAEIIGKLARRNFKAGERIVARALDQPKEVLSGETVHVKVIDGTASLSFDAIAQGGGRTGDSVWVHNPTSGKNFRAVIENKGKVVVRPAPGE